MLVMATESLIGARWGLFQLGDRCSWIESLGSIAGLTISDVDDPPLTVLGDVGWHEPDDAIGWSIGPVAVLSSEWPPVLVCKCPP